jgi:hypothetical protein
MEAAQGLAGSARCKRKKVTKQLKIAGKKLKAAGKAVAKGRAKKKGLSAECGTALQAVIDSATGRLGTNIRAAGHDEPVRLSPADVMGLQGSLVWIDDDEQVEVRPDTVRLRKDKVFLDRRARSSVGPHSGA